MKNFVRFFLSLLLVSTLAATELNDPAQEFLIAYQSFQQAERLERAGKRNEAIAKYRYAEAVLKALSSKNPDWQQPVVDYRLHKVKDSLTRLTGTLDEGSSEQEESSGTNISEETAASSAPQNGLVDKAGEQKVNDAPSISITPPSTAKSLSDPQITQLQRQLKKTELELEKARHDLNDKVTELDHSRVVIVDMKSQLEKTERQVADLKTDLSKTRLRSTEREEALKQSVRTLESKVDALAADQEVVLEENKQLQDHLNQAAASLVAGLGTKKHLEELQVELNTEKNNAAALHQKLLAAQHELSATSELNSTLKKQLLEATTSLHAAEKEAQAAGSLHLQIEKLQTDHAALETQMSGMKKEQEETAKRLAEARAAHVMLEKNQQKALADAQGKSEASMRECQLMGSKKLEVEKKLAEAYEKMKTFEESSSHQVAVKEEIARYKKQLQESSVKLLEQEKKIAALEEAQPEKSHLLVAKEKELADARLDSEKLQKDLVSATQKLSALQAEVQLKDDRYNQLKNQLGQKNEELFALKKKSDSHQLQENAIAENELLKGIVIRELKAEAKRQQIKKLITEDLEKLKVNSVTLLSELKKLAKPIKLTPEEKALFKDAPVPPSAAASAEEEDDDLLMLSAAAPKKEDHSKEKEETTGSKDAPSANTHNAGKEKTAEPSAPSIPSEEEKIKADTSEKHRALVATAKEQFEHHNYFEAEKNFQDALALVPDDYLTLSNLGVVEFQLGKMSEAEAVLKKAAALDQKKSFALTTLGIVEYRQERMDDAEKDLRQAIAINSQDFTAHNYLGIVLAASGKGKAGESEIMKSLEINPQYADAHFNLAVIYATGKPPAKEMAKTHYQKAISLGAPADAALEKLLN
ncbi:MAG: tetratricopeptide repeat protein [Chthoniobacterales bacterium]